MHTCRQTWLSSDSHTTQAHTKRQRHTQARIFTFLRPVHGASPPVWSFNCLDEGGGIRRDQNLAEEIASVKCVRTARLFVRSFKKCLPVLPRLSAFDLLRQYPGATPRKALNSYQRADFPRDRKKMRVPALQEVRVDGPGAVST